MASAKQYAIEQLIGQGKSVADACQVIEVSQPTYHRWRTAVKGDARRRSQAPESAGERTRRAKTAARGGDAGKTKIKNLIAPGCIACAVMGNV
jgi:transposase-like protein